MEETKRYDFRKMPKVEEVDEHYIYAYAKRKGIDTMKECVSIIENNTTPFKTKTGKESVRINRKKMAEEFIEKYYQKALKKEEKKDVLAMLKEDIIKAEEKAKKKKETK